jgi:hypothetical protein
MAGRPAIKTLLDIVRDIDRQTEPSAPEISDFSEADEKVLEQIKVRPRSGNPSNESPDPGAVRVPAAARLSV